MEKVTVFDHPLIQHKTTILRQKSTNNKEFRELVEEITMLMCFEALRDLPLEEVEIETPMKKTKQKPKTSIAERVIEKPQNCWCYVALIHIY